MHVLASAFVGRPIAILCVGLMLGILALMTQRARPSRALWVAVSLWLAYAGWEWLVQVRTPEADIRVDLLLIWPILAIATLWGLFRVMRPKTVR